MLTAAEGRLAPLERRPFDVSGQTARGAGAIVAPSKVLGGDLSPNPGWASLAGFGSRNPRALTASGSPGFGGGDGQSGTAIVTKTKPRTKRPNLYRVLLLNDDYTPMEFVVHVLERFFNKNREDATRIMLHVHQNGVGECGVFTYEVAETKVTQVMDFARKHQHPLQCVMEKK